MLIVALNAPSGYFGHPPAPLQERYNTKFRQSAIAQHVYVLHHIIEIEGKTILHAGDTSLYKNMKLIGQQHSIDLAFLPIGDRFKMGIDDTGPSN